jgi:hypothetical protein
MNIATFRQELIGIINLSLPFAFACYFFPSYAFSFWGIMLYACAIGAYLAYTTYNKTQLIIKSLMYEPTGIDKDLFDAEIVRCGLQSSPIIIRYAYTDDAVAMTMSKVIVIDPMLWSGINDPVFLKAKTIIETHVLPGVPQEKKAFHAKIEEALTPDAQKFIFRHELGHIAAQFTIKRIMLTQITGMLFTTFGLYSAYWIMPTFGALGAYATGIIIAACVDLAFSYGVNQFFKARSEKNADLFAARFSSPEEINAAADFFVHYETAAQEYRKTINDIIHPPVFLTGYIDGITRANYLRILAMGKE